MVERICAEASCTEAPDARGFCNKHYLRRWRAGSIEPFDRSLQHRIADVDAEARTGTCQICGPTPVRLRDSRGAVCMTVRRAEYVRASAKGPRSSRSPEGRRRESLRTKYQMTIQDYETLLALQNGVCGICGYEPPPDTPRLAVDHNHETGVIRGLLCGPCNRGLGLYRDDPVRLRIAARWAEMDGVTHAFSAEQPKAGPPPIR